MAIQSSSDRGTWNSKLGFVLAAAGSAVGLGNIWAFPNQVADNGGAAFLIVYLLCCFFVGYPVMVAELAIGRRTAKNPVGAFKALSGRNAFWPLVGFWGIICGAGILAFYNVVAGWTLGFVFEEIFFAAGATDLAAVFSDLGGGPKNAVLAAVFMVATILIVRGGVSDGIERATKTMMPLLIGILLLMIVYVVFQDGAGEGLRRYLYPDFSRIDTNLVISAMGQAFFSLSLGMGALITYGSYLQKNQNLPEAAGYVTLADISIAFLAGLLVMPAMFVAQKSGVQIFDAQGNLESQTGLVFNVLPELFHRLGALGVVFGVLFFLLLSIAALTSTISLLEVPTSYLIDERGIPRKKAAMIVGGGVGVLSLIIAMSPSLIGPFATIFNTIGLPAGGLAICLFVGYFWKTERALLEIEEGYAGVEATPFGSLWPIFVRYVCPLLIFLVFVSSTGILQWLSQG